MIPAVCVPRQAPQSPVHRVPVIVLGPLLTRVLRYAASQQVLQKTIPRVREVYYVGQDQIENLFFGFRFKITVVSTQTSKENV